MGKTGDWGINVPSRRAPRQRKEAAQMANKPQTVTKSRASYTRYHFAALRAYVQRIPASTIGRLYFSKDDDGNEATPAWVESFLTRMQAELVELAVEHGSSVLADHLKSSAKAHGSARLTAVTQRWSRRLRFWPSPSRSRRTESACGSGPLGCPTAERRGHSNLAELVHFCNRGGGGWGRAVPRIGPGRAQLVVSWLRQNEDAIGARVGAKVSLDDPFSAPEGELSAHVLFETRRSSGDQRESYRKRLWLQSPLHGTRLRRRTLRYTYEKYLNDTAEAYLKRGDDWQAAGSQLETADFRFHPKELPGMLYALRGEAERRFAELPPD